MIDLVTEIKLDGLVATNTTINRKDLITTTEKLDEIGAGGLSGKPLFKKSGEVIRYIHQKTNGQLPLMGSGGIFTPKDAQQKMNDGAVLIQVWTGFIYEGPAIVKNICNALK